MLTLLALLALPQAPGDVAAPPAAQAPGFFRTQKIGDRWWFLDPQGRRFLSIGVTAARYEGDRVRDSDRLPYRDVCEAKYGSRDAWTAAAVEFLRGLGFNSLGAWCGEYLFDRGLPYTVILNLAASSGADWLHGGVADFWSTAFEQTADDVCRKLCAPHRDDPQLLGYYLDNELRWGPDWRATTTLVEEYLMLPADAPGHVHAVDFLRERYKTAADLAAAWKIDLADWPALDAHRFTNTYRTQAAWDDARDFVALAARRYFEVCHAALLRHDPNHLDLGCRDDMASSGLPVAEASRGLVDVFSVNYYVPLAFAPPLKTLAEASGAPILITEWSFRSRDSGLPNTQGAGPLVDTEADRAEKYRQYVTDLFAQPYVVGAHWFKYTDEPAEGRFDGENSNYGLVNIHDEPYKLFTEAVKQANAEIYRIHAGQ